MQGIFPSGIGITIVLTAHLPKQCVVGRHKHAQMGLVTAPAAAGMGTVTAMTLAGMTAVTPPRQAATGTVLANPAGTKEFVKAGTASLITVPATAVFLLTTTKVYVRVPGVTGPRDRIILVLTPVV